MISLFDERVSEHDLPLLVSFSFCHVSFQIAPFKCDK